MDVASRVRAFEQLAPAKHLLNDFHSAATKLMAALWPNGPTEVGPRNWSAVRDGDRWVFVAETRAPELLAEVVARFGPMVELANAARPVDQDRRTKNGPRAAIAKAREIHRAGRNWTVEAVAAAVLLTGVDVDDLDDIVAKYLKADTRKPRIRPRKRR